ncbi:XK-related protein 7 isoform X2 [Procambarus clarkii]
MEEMRVQLNNATNGAGKVLAAGAAGARQVTKQGIKTLTQPMEMSKFGWFDVLTALLSMGMFYFDVTSDVLVAYYMYNDEATHDWFLTTVLLLVIPLVVVNGFSLYWYWFDENVCESEGMCYKLPKSSPCLWAFRIIAHILLQSSILRSLDVIYYGIQSVRKGTLVPSRDHNHHQRNMMVNVDENKLGEGSREATNACSLRRPYRELWVHAERDAANVDVLSSLLQDAPQLILQLYIMTHTIPSQALEGEISQTLMMQLLSVGASLVAMALSVASFSKATRLAEPSIGNLSPAGLLLLSLSHFCSIAPQVLCFALFAGKYLIVFLVLVSCHWLATSILVLIQLLCCANPLRIGSIFTHDIRKGPCNRLDDIAFSAVFGMILLYTFVNVGGKAPKIQAGVYHFLRLVEEACMLAFWYLTTEGNLWYHWLPLVLVSLLCVLGIVFFSLYYFCANPDHRYKKQLAV